MTAPSQGPDVAMSGGMQQESTRPAGAAASIFRIDRRPHARHVLVRRSGIVHAADGSRQPCVVVNLSAGGLLARTYLHSVPGARVGVELAPGEMIGGSVLWTQDWSMGIAFDDLIDVDALMERQWVAEQDQERRRSPRFPVSCPASLRVNARFHFGRICDFSGGGARFRGAKAIKKTGPAVLTLPDLPPLRSGIAWTRERDCGLVFGEAIPPEAISRWLSRRKGGVD